MSQLNRPSAFKGGRNPMFRRIETLLQRAQDQPTMDRLEDFARYLVGENSQGSAYVHYILDTLDPCLIPETSPSSGSNWENFAALAGNALDALAALTAVLESLHRAPAGMNAVSFSESCYRLLSERWDGVAQWLKYLIVHSSASNDARVPVAVCSHALHSIILDYTHNRYKEDIVSRANTVDIIYLALSQTNANTGRHHYLTTMDDEPCALLQLFYTYTAEQCGRDAMQLRLGSMGSKARRRLISALLARSDQLMGVTAGEVKSRGFLVLGVSKLLTNRKESWRLFKAEEWLPQQIAQLLNIGLRAERKGVTSSYFWHMFANSASAIAVSLIQCAAAPTKCVHSLVEKGFFTCASISFSHLPLDSPKSLLVTALGRLLPYLYLSNLSDAAEDRGEIAMWGEDRKLQMDLGPIYLEYRTALRCAYNAHIVDYGVSLSMCSYSRHSPESEQTCQFRNGDFGVRVCSQCHTATYCSYWCQKEDWDRYHRFECRRLRKIYDCQKSDGDWVSVPTKMDQLRIIQTTANKNLPAPAQVRKRDLTTTEAVPPCQLPKIKFHPTSSVTTLSFYTQADALQFCPRLSLLAHLTIAWTDSVYGFLEPRLQGYFADMESNPDKVILVDGYFRVSETKVMHVLTKMSYDPGAFEGEEYTVVSSIFRLLDNVRGIPTVAILTANPPAEIL